MYHCSRISRALFVSTGRRQDQYNVKPSVYGPQTGTNRGEDMLSIEVNKETRIEVVPGDAIILWQGDEVINEIPWGEVKQDQKEGIWSIVEQSLRQLQP